MRKLIGSIVVIIFAFGVVFAQERTIVKSSKAKKMLMGRHKIALQWISWDFFGRANVTEKRGVMYLKGRQDGGEKNFVTVDGIITSVSEKEFTFDGKVVTQVSHINGGEPCTREGEMTFRITGKRKYWRLMEMDNPCDQVTDYVDIFFRGA